MSQIIDGKKLAEKVKDQLRPVPPHGGLGVIMIGHNPASEVYVKQKAKLAHELNIPFETLRLTEWDDWLETKEDIQDFCERKDLAGIIVQLPLPSEINPIEVLELVPLAKDVDGLKKSSTFIPATARGVMRALKSTGTLLTGKHAVILGRSKLVGKPLIDLLLAENCTVTIAHSYTQNLPSITKTADILISAVGKPGLINGDMVKDGVIAIDVGITRTDDGLKGDFVFDEVTKKANFITPVPGGIGPLTVVFLMANVLGR